MGYSTTSAVRELTAIPETSEWDSRITEWILDSDAKIDEKLGGGWDPVPRLISRLSALLTAVKVLDRLKAEGALDSFRLGAYQDQDPLSAVESAIKDYEAEAKEIFRLYSRPVVKSTEYEHIEDCD